MLAIGAMGCTSGSTPASPDVPVVPVVPVRAGIPEGWFGSTPTGFQVGSAAEHHGGTAAVYLSGSSSATGGTFAALSQIVSAENYRGKRLRWSGWAKSNNVNASNSGLWMRIDGPGTVRGFDNMSSRPIKASTDWHQISVVLDVPSNALGITMGVLFDGTGTLFVDDLTLEVVGTEVPATAPVISTANGSDSATVAGSYARAGTAPLNLNFEGIAPLSEATIAWLSANSSTLATTDPTGSLDDLEPLRQMVGDAHVVGMGEGTHGTRDFFLMKHRLLEFLVTRMGFTYFAIEATSPEADDMNRYVLTGAGDPKTLLSRLYFWTWNTQEVFDMIQWMREWNRTAPAAQRVQFLGFDMQSPGASMDSVAAFVARFDPANSASIADRFACLKAYRNNGSASGASTTFYAAQATSAKAACAAGLAEVYALIDAHHSAYQAATSASTYQSVLHHARLVQQFETMAAGGSSARDNAMAENVAWIREQAGSQAKIALWAHNGHINAVTGSMGGYLRERYATDYRPIGFLFAKGRFNAVGSGSPLQAFEATQVPNGSMESAFLATGKSLALFDARRIDGGGADAAPFHAPIRMRSIGAIFSPANEGSYFYSVALPHDFDLLLYVANPTQSTLLPFVY